MHMRGPNRSNRTYVGLYNDMYGGMTPIGNFHP